MFQVNSTKTQPVVELEQLVREERWAELQAEVLKHEPAELAAVLQRLPEKQQRRLFAMVPEQRAAQVLPYLPYFEQFVLLRARPRVETAQIVNEMEPDERMRLLDELPQSSWEQLIAELSPEERKITDQLASYPRESVGRYMTPAFIALDEESTAVQALELVRSEGRTKETVDVTYVLDGEGRLVGEVRLGSLVMARPEQKVRELCDLSPLAVKDSDRLDEVVELFEKYARLALPVVDDAGKMLGIVTVDDVMDVARRMATREMQKFGGMEALDAPYFAVGFWQMLKKRGSWLALLFFG